MTDGTALSSVDAQAILGALRRHSPRRIIALRPDTIDGRIVDAVVVWLTEPIGLTGLGLEVGQRISDLASRQSLQDGVITAAIEAWSTPGVLTRTGPIEVDDGVTTRHLHVSIVAESDLLILEYDDVTDAVTSRAAAETSEHNFHALLDGLDAGVVLLRPFLTDAGTFGDAEIVWTNEASKRMWLDQEGLAPGTRVGDVYYDRIEWLDAANRAWRGEPVTRILHVDPAVAPWTSATETIRRVGDLLVELTIDRTSDQQLLDRLAELDERFAALVADLPLTVLVARVGEDELAFVSPNAEALTGRPIHLLHRVDQWEDLIHPDDHPIRDRLVQALVDHGESEGVMRYIRADGTTFTAGVRMVRRRSTRGRDGFITLISDISEQQRMRERIESGDRLETLGRTAGSIAHDFNNLLMIVSGSIDRAARQLVDENLALDTAAVATRRAADLATGLLSFARGRPGAPTEIAVGPLVRSFEPILRALLYPTAQLDLDIDDRELVVFANATHLEQVVLNLVTNARDASPEGSRVEVRVRLADGAQCHLLDEPAGTSHVAISVHDHGPGVPASIAPRIWEPFFSAKPATDDSGTGLGLSTVHGVVHQHGGHVHLETGTTSGTTFTVFLPLLTEADQHAGTEAR